MAPLPARVTRAAAALCAALAVAAAPADAGAQPRLYKYRDASGVRVYSDRPPEGVREFEEATLERQREPTEVRVFRRVADDGEWLVAQNTYFAPVQIAYRLASMRNVAPDTPQRGLEVLPPRSETDLLLVRPADPAQPMEFEYRFRFLLGDPRAVHAPTRPYRLPYALASAFHVSQAFPSIITHVSPESRHAFDFEMPVGTAVHAAREGVVIEVASDYFDAGLDPATDGPRANIVRILHDDGTMALYAHLNWNSIRVVPGQRVERGESIADSGNTGFSTGPHLHFVVQRNADGRMESVPVEFAGPGGAPVEVHTGDRPVAY
ncbi:MAG TPA: M23 family metallopeptidase [Gammaproteobacteria bacterium]